MPPSERVGSKNGRAWPSRFNVGDHVMTNYLAPVGYRARRGRITDIRDSEMEYLVEFEDGLRPITGFLMAKWLER